MTDDLSCQERVKRLAELLLRDGLSEAFRDRARELAADLESDDIQDLTWLLLRQPPEPEGYSTSQHGLGGWISACQFAVFELLYNIGEPALPAIRKIAWGEYDWTQGNAIELLIRFAADGIHSDEIVAEIKARFPDIRNEAQLYAVQPLLGRLESEPALAEVFRVLRSCAAFDEAVEELSG